MIESGRTLKQTKSLTLSKWIKLVGPVILVIWFHHQRQHRCLHLDLKHKSKSIDAPWIYLSIFFCLAFIIIVVVVLIYFFYRSKWIRPNYQSMFIVDDDELVWFSNSKNAHKEMNILDNNKQKAIWKILLFYVQ